MKRVTMRRMTLLGLFAGLVVVATPLTASAGYPPDSPTITTEGSGVAGGGTTTVTCTGFDPGSTVQFTFEPGGASLGSATADAGGGCSATVTIPCAPGAGTIFASGTSGGAPVTVSTGITVTACAVEADLALTGASGDTPLYAGGGAALVVIGAALVLLFRRRHTQLSA